MDFKLSSKLSVARYSPDRRKGPDQIAFVKLMDLYEQNYILFRQLAPKLGAVQTRSISSKTQNVDLHLQVLEKEKFTTTVFLTYSFYDQQGDLTRLSTKPDLVLRIYHDAKNVEVMSASFNGKQLSLSQSKVGLSERYRLNRFLNKWLKYLLKQNYKFTIESEQDFPSLFKP